MDVAIRPLRTPFPTADGLRRKGLISVSSDSELVMRRITRSSPLTMLMLSLLSLLYPVKLRL